MNGPTASRLNFLRTKIFDLPDLSTRANAVAPRLSQVSCSVRGRIHEMVAIAAILSGSTTLPGCGAIISAMNGGESPCERADYPEEWDEYCPDHPGRDETLFWDVVTDNDGDGYYHTSRGAEQPEDSLGYDCDDEDPKINEGADEVCDGFDNDCDGEIDNDAIDATAWYPDNDGDGFGSAEAEALWFCAQPEDQWIVYVEDNSDPNDFNSSIHP